MLFFISLWHVKEIAESSKHLPLRVPTIPFDERWLCWFLLCYRLIKNTVIIKFLFKKIKFSWNIKTMRKLTTSHLLKQNITNVKLFCTHTRAIHCSLLGSILKRYFLLCLKHTPMLDHHLEILHPSSSPIQANHLSMTSYR